MQQFQNEGKQAQSYQYPPLVGEYMSGAPDETEMVETGQSNETQQNYGAGYRYRAYQEYPETPQYESAEPQYEQNVAPQMQIQYVPVMRQREENSDGKILAAISYLGVWVSGLLLFLFVRDNKFIRFHALQSLLFFGGAMLLYIIAPIAFEPFWGLSWVFEAIAALGFFVVTLVATVGWFVGLFGALTGKYLKLPLAGDLAAHWLKLSETGTVK